VALVLYKLHMRRIHLRHCAPKLHSERVYFIYMTWQVLVYGLACIASNTSSLFCTLCLLCQLCAGGMSAPVSPTLQCTYANTSSGCLSSGYQHRWSFNLCLFTFSVPNYLLNNLLKCGHGILNHSIYDRIVHSFIHSFIHSIYFPYIPLSMNMSRKVVPVLN
jgi:hypothetical protein